MDITILVENQIGHDAAKVCLAEWGLSFFVQAYGVNILFDTAHTGIYKQNAERLNIDLQSTDFVVLSHSHWDHAGGLQHHNFIDKKKLIIHPDLIGKLASPAAIKMRSDFEITYSEDPLEFSDGIYFLGEIPRVSSFEKGTYKVDNMLDDTAIAVKSDNGVIVITGCSHSGICNICEHAKAVTGQQLYAVIGGFHLMNDDPRAVNGTIEYFKSEKPRHLYPMHCVDFQTMAKFHSVFGVNKLSTGDRVRL